MSNPFDVINDRLTSIEEILAKISNQKQNIVTKEEDDLVGLTEAAKILHLSEDRLYAIHKDHFPLRKPGKYLLFSKKELMDFINGKPIVKGGVLNVK